MENNEEVEEGDIYTDLENNIENAKNQINQVKNNKYNEAQEQEQEDQDVYMNENEKENMFEEQNNNEDDEDDRLTYTLITLDLGELIHIFEENNISFVDMLLLTKEDLKELQLKLYQRNRIHNFSVLFTKYAKSYSISEISDFFSFNQKFIFNSSIYDRVIMSQNQNDILENNEDEISADDIEDNNDENNNNDIIEQQEDNYNLDNISYSDYMNLMNKKTINDNIDDNEAYKTQKVKAIKNNKTMNKYINNNTNYNYNDIKYNTFNNNNNYNNNYYLSTDGDKNQNQIKKEKNNFISEIKDIKNTSQNQKINTISSKTAKLKSNNNLINKDKNVNNKKEKEKNIYQPKEQKSKLSLNKTPIQVKNDINTINTNSSNNSNLKNSSNITFKKKSSNRINAVINKYLEIKQDTDEFLEKLNKKKIDSENKYNKYNILIKKKSNLASLTSKINPNLNDTDNLNQINSNKIISNNDSSKKKGKKITSKINKSTKIEEFKQINTPLDDKLKNEEIDLNLNIENEYQRMINHIEELEQMNLDGNSNKHLNQIKNSINAKNENLSLDDILKINGELIRMIEYSKRKENLKKILENYNLKIEHNKQLLNELNEIDDNEQNDNNENFEFNENENYPNQLNYINYQNINSNNNKNMNKFNQYLSQVEEDYENEISNKNNKII